jgi:hypothetical protein
MKSILKTLLVTALAGSLFGALLRKFVSQQPRVPTVNPVSDAEPNVEEPLQESDLRVAQNSPL